jgi:hypothetical protein
MVSSGSGTVADGNLTLGEAVAVWKRQRDLGNGELDAGQPLEKPPQQANSGPVGPGGVERVSPMEMPGDGR